MKKIMLILLLIVSSSFNFISQTAAEQTSEDKLLKSAVISLLIPQIVEAFEEYYGPKASTQFYCEKIINLRQPTSEEGSNYFELEMEAITFEGPHAPPHDLINIKFSNFPTGEWKVKSFSAKRLSDEEAMTYKCN